LLEATDHLLRLQSLVVFDKVAYDCTAVFPTSPFLAVSPPMGLLKCRTGNAGRPDFINVRRIA